jgi:hypothetical protein
VSASAEARYERDGCCDPAHSVRRVGHDPQAQQNREDARDRHRVRISHRPMQVRPGTRRSCSRAVRYETSPQTVTLLAPRKTPVGSARRWPERTRSTAAPTPEVNEQPLQLEHGQARAARPAQRRRSRRRVQSSPSRTSGRTAGAVPARAREIPPPRAERGPSPGPGSSRHPRARARPPAPLRVRQWQPIRGGPDDGRHERLRIERECGARAGRAMRGARIAIRAHLAGAVKIRLRRARRAEAGGRRFPRVSRTATSTRYLPDGSPSPRASKMRSGRAPNGSFPVPTHGRTRRPEESSRESRPRSSRRSRPVRSS